MQDYFFSTLPEESRQVYTLDYKRSLESIRNAYDNLNEYAKKSDFVYFTKQEEYELFQCINNINISKEKQDELLNNSKNYLLNDTTSKYSTNLSINFAHYSENYIIPSTLVATFLSTLSYHNKLEYELSFSDRLFYIQFINYLLSKKKNYLLIKNYSMLLEYLIFLINFNDIDPKIEYSTPPSEKTTNSKLFYSTKYYAFRKDFPIKLDWRIYWDYYFSLMNNIYSVNCDFNYDCITQLFNSLNVFFYLCNQYFDPFDNSTIYTTYLNLYDETIHKKPMDDNELTSDNSMDLEEDLNKIDCPTRYTFPLKIVSLESELQPVLPPFTQCPLASLPRKFGPLVEYALRFYPYGLNERFRNGEGIVLLAMCLPESYPYYSELFPIVYDLYLDTPHDTNFYLFFTILLKKCLLNIVERVSNEINQFKQQNIPADNWISLLSTDLKKLFLQSSSNSNSFINEFALGMLNNLSIISSIKLSYMKENENRNYCYNPLHYFQNFGITATLTKSEIIYLLIYLDTLIPIISVDSYNEFIKLPSASPIEQPERDVPLENSFLTPFKNVILKAKEKDISLISIDCDYPNLYHSSSTHASSTSQIKPKVSIFSTLFIRTLRSLRIRNQTSSVNDLFNQYYVELISTIVSQSSRVIGNNLGQIIFQSDLYCNKLNSNIQIKTSSTSINITTDLQVNTLDYLLENIFFNYLEFFFVSSNTQHTTNSIVNGLTQIFEIYPNFFHLFYSYVSYIFENAVVMSNELSMVFNFICSLTNVFFPSAVILEYIIPLFDLSLEHFNYQYYHVFINFYYSILIEFYPSYYKIDDQIRTDENKKRIFSFYNVLKNYIKEKDIKSFEFENYSNAIYLNSADQLLLKKIFKYLTGTFFTKFLETIVSNSNSLSQKFTLVEIKTLITNEPVTTDDGESVESDDSKNSSQFYPLFSNLLAFLFELKNPLINFYECLIQNRDYTKEYNNYERNFLSKVYINQYNVFIENKKHDDIVDVDITDVETPILNAAESSLRAALAAAQNSSSSVEPSIEDTFESLFNNINSYNDLILYMKKVAPFAFSSTTNLVESSNNPYVSRLLESTNFVNDLKLFNNNKKYILNLFLGNDIKSVLLYKGIINGLITGNVNILPYFLLLILSKDFFEDKFSDEIVAYRLSLISSALIGISSMNSKFILPFYILLIKKKNTFLDSTKNKLRKAFNEVTSAFFNTFLSLDHLKTVQNRYIHNFFGPFSFDQNNLDVNYKVDQKNTANGISCFVKPSTKLINQFITPLLEYLLSDSVSEINNVLTQIGSNISSGTVSSTPATDEMDIATSSSTSSYNKLENTLFSNLSFLTSLTNGINEAIIDLYDENDEKLICTIPKYYYNIDKKKLSPKSLQLFSNYTNIILNLITKIFYQLFSIKYSRNFTVSNLSASKYQNYSNSKFIVYELLNLGHMAITKRINSSQDLTKLDLTKFTDNSIIFSSLREELQYLRKNYMISLLKNYNIEDDKDRSTKKIMSYYLYTIMNKDIEYFSDNKVTIEYLTQDQDNFSPVDLYRNIISQYNPNYISPMQYEKFWLLIRYFPLFHGCVFFQFNCCRKSHYHTKIMKYYVNPDTPIEYEQFAKNNLSSSLLASNLSELITQNLSAIDNSKSDYKYSYEKELEDPLAYPINQFVPTNNQSLLYYRFLDIFWHLSCHNYDAFRNAIYPKYIKFTNQFVIYNNYFNMNFVKNRLNFSNSPSEVPRLVIDNKDTYAYIITYMKYLYKILKVILCVKLYHEGYNNYLYSHSTNGYYIARVDLMKNYLSIAYFIEKNIVKSEQKEKVYKLLSSFTKSYFNFSTTSFEFLLINRNNFLFMYNLIDTLETLKKLNFNEYLPFLFLTLSSFFDVKLFYFAPYKLIKKIIDLYISNLYDHNAIMTKTFGLNFWFRFTYCLLLSKENLLTGISSSFNDEDDQIKEISLNSEEINEEIFTKTQNEIDNLSEKEKILYFQSELDRLTDNYNLKSSLNEPISKLFDSKVNYQKMLSKVDKVISYFKKLFNYNNKTLWKSIAKMFSKDFIFLSQLAINFRTDISVCFLNPFPDWIFLRYTSYVKPIFWYFFINLIKLDIISLEPEIPLKQVSNNDEMDVETKELTYNDILTNFFTDLKDYLPKDDVSDLALYHFVNANYFSIFYANYFIQNEKKAKEYNALKNKGLNVDEKNYVYKSDYLITLYNIISNNLENFPYLFNIYFITCPICFTLFPSMNPFIFELFKQFRSVISRNDASLITETYKIDEFIEKNLPLSDGQIIIQEKESSINFSETFQTQFLLMFFASVRNYFFYKGKLDLTTIHFFSIFCDESLYFLSYQSKFDFYISQFINFFNVFSRKIKNDEFITFNNSSSYDVIEQQLLTYEKKNQENYLKSLTDPIFKDELNKLEYVNNLISDINTLSCFYNFIKIFYLININNNYNSIKIPNSQGSLKHNSISSILCGLIENPIVLRDYFKENYFLYKKVFVLLFFMVDQSNYQPVFDALLNYLSYRPAFYNEIFSDLFRIFMLENFNEVDDNIVEDLIQENEVDSILKLNANEFKSEENKEKYLTLKKLWLTKKNSLISLNNKNKKYKKYFIKTYFSSNSTDSYLSDSIKNYFFSFFKSFFSSHYYILNPDNKLNYKNYLVQNFSNPKINNQLLVNFKVFLSYKSYDDLNTIIKVLTNNLNKLADKEKQNKLLKRSTPNSTQSSTPSTPSPADTSYAIASSSTVSAKIPASYWSNIFMAAAIIELFPYDLPQLLPELMISFQRHSHYYYEIRLVVINTLKSFMETHKYRWENDLKKFFTSQQLDDLFSNNASHFIS